jgi:RNA polymerase primary sigma factor
VHMTEYINDLSLENPVGQEDEERLGEFIEDHWAVAPPDAASFGMMRDEMDSVLQTLSAQERGVIELRFGLTGGMPRTLEEVGRVFGITHERIRQIEAKTFCKLRHPARRLKLSKRAPSQGRSSPPHAPT